MAVSVASGGVLKIKWVLNLLDYARVLETSLYAEMESLHWVAFSMKDMRITSIRFEMDGSDLMDTIFNPMDWPAFAS